MARCGLVAVRSHLVTRRLLLPGRISRMRDSRHHIASLLKEQLDCDLTSYFLSAAPHECHEGDGGDGEECLLSERISEILALLPWSLQPR